MNETIETLRQRTSLRIYAKKPVSSEDKEQILECAIKAPTAGNMMTYSIIVVESQSKKRNLKPYM